jgi:hypothetical protein
VVGPCRRLQHRWTARCRCPRPQPLSSPGGPGNTTTTLASTEHEPRAVPANPRLGAFRIVACFRTPDSNSRTTQEPLSPHDPAIRAERRIEDELAARDQASVPRSGRQVAPARRRSHQAGAERLAKRRLEPVRPVAHDEDSHGSIPRVLSSRAERPARPCARRGRLAQ